MAHPRRGARLALTLVAALTFGGLTGPPALATGTVDHDAAQVTSSPDGASTTSEPAAPVAPPQVPAAPAQTPAATAEATVDLVSPTPTVAGELVVGQKLTANTGTWSPEFTLSYSWLADGVPIRGATAPTFVLTAAQAKTRVQVAVTGTLADGTRTTRTSAPGLRVATAGTPAVTGKTAVGSTLTSTRGTWTYNTNFTYQWLADGVDIPGATAPTFRLAAAQSGRAIAVRVTGTKSGYPTVSRVSKATPTRVMNWTTPSIGGTVAVGSTLTARTGSWTWGTSHVYQWYANGAPISGATAKTLRLTSAQKDKNITVKVTGRKAGHLTVAKTSAKTGKVMTAGTVKISGTALHGATLKASPGTWTSGTTLKYRWYADGAAISGATSSSLKLSSGQRDKKISVRVTGSRSGYATVTKSSASTLRVQTAPAAKISGTPRVTQTLTAVSGTWSSGTALSYRWYANGSALSGKTSRTLKLGTGQVGKTITVKITGRKSGYPTVTRTSAKTSVVAYPSRTPGHGDGSCPSWAPIKGNANSMIYHVPGGQFYKITKAEECFRTESAAVAAGYRKSKR